LLPVAQTVLLAPVHDLSVANADWLVRSVASAMVWMAITHALRRVRPNERRELIVEQNFIGGCVLVDYFREPIRQFTDILRELRSEVSRKSYALRGGGSVYMLAFVFGTGRSAVYAMQNKKSTLFIGNSFKLAWIERA